MPSVSSNDSLAVVVPPATLQAEAAAREAKRPRTLDAPVHFPSTPPDIGVNKNNPNHGLEALLAAHSAAIVQSQASLLRSYEETMQAKLRSVEASISSVNAAQDLKEATNRPRWIAVVKL